MISIPASGLGFKGEWNKKDWLKGQEVIERCLQVYREV